MNDLVSLKFSLLTPLDWKQEIHHINYTVVESYVFLDGCEVCDLDLVGCLVCARFCIVFTVAPTNRATAIWYKPNLTKAFLDSEKSDRGLQKSETLSGRLGNADLRLQQTSNRRHTLFPFLCVCRLEIESKPAMLAQAHGHAIRGSVSNKLGYDRPGSERQAQSFRCV